MKKTLIGLLAASALVPVAAFALFDCGATGCADESLIHISSDPSQPMEHRIQALQALIGQLLAKIATIKAAQSVGPSGENNRCGSSNEGVLIPSTSQTGTNYVCVMKAPNKSCPLFTSDLIMGSTDKETYGQVSQLQLWLKAEGYFPDATGTGYYGEKTAAAVRNWQKAHGMDFVTLTSGVGTMTRAKILEACTGSKASGVRSSSWKASSINPNADSYHASEQEIYLEIIDKNGAVKTYIVGRAYGCPAVTEGVPGSWNGKQTLGALSCYYALSGTQFVAYLEGDSLIIEKGTESAKDGSVSWSRVLTASVQ